MGVVVESLVPGARVGRFELRRILGQGAQATVWLAFDARLEREVALKLLRDGADGALEDWLAEARHAGRLTHPHIVPVFEADVHDGRPCLVFEYVAGGTLAGRLRREGRLSPGAAVPIMLGVLDALQAAHAAGIVHRDLKPSNILLDALGRPRVMDFGIAARLHAGAAERRIVGTPGYIAPEAARGEPPAASMDVFAAGVVLVEMLSGVPLLRERDPLRAIARVAVESLPLPAFEAEVDDALRAVARRAIARDPAERWPDASTLHAALSQWLRPASPATSFAAPKSGTLDFLLRRMRHRSDFPALSAAMMRIQRLAESDEASLGSLASEILADVALTQKLLRLVNTAQYRHAGAGSISTVSRAVALVGFAGIRNLALSLLLLEHMQDRAHAGQIRQEFLRSLLAGTLARELCAGSREGEEAFLAALFQGLGRLLAEYYLPEEAGRVRALVQAGEGAAAPSEAQAACSVLGLSYEELGVGVARSWGLPEALRRCMSRPLGRPAQRVAERDRPRWLAAAANDVADALVRCEAAAQAPRIEAIGARYGAALGLGHEELKAAVERSRERLAHSARAMGLPLPPGLSGPPSVGAATDSLPPALHEESLGSHRLRTTPPPAEEVDPRTLPGKASDLLAAGIQDIADSMAAESFRLDDVLRMILETMYRAIGFRRVVLCLRDAKSSALTGRFGLGEDVAAACEAFKVPLAADPRDLFTTVCLKNADTLIADATAPGIGTRLPAWFRRSIDAPAFLLLPLAAHNTPFGLIYADKTLPGAIQLGEKELSMLRTLRNQAVMAFRQAGRS